VPLHPRSTLAGTMRGGPGNKSIPIMGKVPSTSSPVVWGSPRVLLWVHLITDPKGEAQAHPN